MEQRILLIEDNLDITRVVQYELEQAGYRVMTAPDGISGLTSARENIPDLVILDLGLPDFDGAEIARRLAYVEALRTDPKMAQFLAWVRTKPDDFHAATRMTRDRRGAKRKPR